MKISKLPLFAIAAVVAATSCTGAIRPPDPRPRPADAPPYVPGQPLAGGYLAFTRAGHYSPLFETEYYCDVPIQGSCQGHAETTWNPEDGAGRPVWAAATLTYTAANGWNATTGTWYFFF